MRLRNCKFVAKVESVEIYERDRVVDCLLREMDYDSDTSDDFVLDDAHEQRLFDKTSHRYSEKQIRYLKRNIVNFCFKRKVPPTLRVVQNQILADKKWHKKFEGKSSTAVFQKCRALYVDYFVQVSSFILKTKTIIYRWFIKGAAIESPKAK